MSLILAAIALVVVAIASLLPWWTALIGVALIPTAIVVALMGIAYVPNDVPMVLPAIPPAVHFEEPRAAVALPFR